MARFDLTACKKNRQAGLAEVSILAGQSVLGDSEKQNSATLWRIIAFLRERVVMPNNSSGNFTLLWIGRCNSAC
jgi:hypothetical protein